LRWPQLDVDLSLSSIHEPGAYPLVYEPKTSYGKKHPTKQPKNSDS